MSPHQEDQGRSGGRRRLNPEKLFQAAAADQPASASSATAWEPPPLDELARQFDEFDFVELIGRGGMGAVYRAVQRRLGRTIALKILPPELAADPAFEERFLREARALAELQHPHILTVHDFGERAGYYYLVTEFVEGMNLRELIDMGELSPREALRIAPQICDALQFAHDRGIVHRDIKPENVLIDRQGNVKIADFGLARILGEPGNVALTRSTQVLGTPHYMAPEQWRHGVPVDHRADIYAVGVVLYEMLTGQLPLGAFEPPSSRRGVPEGLDEIVRRSLAQKPEQRYQHVADVREDLEKQEPFVGRCGASRPTDAPKACAEVSRFLRRRWLVAILLFAGSIVATAYIHHRTAMDFLAMREWQSSLTRAEAWAETSGRQFVEGDEEQLLAAFYAEKVIPEWESRNSEARARGQTLRERRPEVPSRPTATALGPIAWIPILLAAIGALALLTWSGFTAIRRIREQGRGPGGLGIAVFTAWLVPVALAAAVPAVILDVNVNDPDLGTLAATITAVILSIAGIVWMTWQHRRISAELG